jgi:threonine/homoserine/homoserine lactone efflux protein
MELQDFLILGIIGGLTPGPITALMIKATLSGGLRKGIKVPLALLLSNLILGPLCISIFLLGTQIEGLLVLMKYLGAGVLLYMGICELKSSGELEPATTASNVFSKSLILDLLNPHPYIFWLTVLAPAIIINIGV